MIVLKNRHKGSESLGNTKQKPIFVLYFRGAAYLQPVLKRILNGMRPTTWLHLIVAFADKKINPEDLQ